MKFSVSNYFHFLLSGGGILASSASAKLVAWYPLDESPSVAAPVIENVEANDASPVGLTGFSGEIGSVNVYDQILDGIAIGEAFKCVASIGPAPGGLAITEVLFNDAADELTITRNSISRVSYNVDFSQSLEAEDWFEFAGPFLADSDQTILILSLPPHQAKFFVRVVVAEEHRLIR